MADTNRKKLQKVVGLIALLCGFAVASVLFGAASVAFLVPVMYFVSKHKVVDQSNNAVVRFSAIRFIGPLFVAFVSASEFMSGISQKITITPVI